MNRSHSFAWILVSLLLFALAAPLQAGIIPGGDVNPANYSWWHNGGDISTDAYIGYSSTGSVTVNLGSDLSSRYSGIGYNAGATGVVTVDGSGSTWTNSSYFGTLVVGNEGQGTLNITDGGSVSSNYHSYIGHEDGSIGEVTVDGSSSAWTNSYSLYVGRSGQGTLNITNGGSVSDSWGGFIGHWSDSTGVVKVDGDGSTWNSGELYVGYWGQGTLNITNGGDVISNYDGYIGWDSTSVVTVAGSGSTWTNSNSLFVGNCGQGTLNITNGGAVSNNYGYIGYNVGSSGEVTVDGAGSTWTNSGDLYVGGNGYGSGGTGELTITNGGSVEVGEMLEVWGTGSLHIGATGKVSVGESLVLKQGSTLTTDAGATIYMTGSAFENKSTNSANLAGLRNLTLIFEGGSGVIDPFEVAGEDMGAVVAGFDSNFALGTLQLGGEAGIGQIQLVDTFDNQPGWEGSEALYTNILTVNTGSILHLNGLTLYYYKGEINGTVLEEGGALVPIEWIQGDANWDIKVDDSDLNLLLTGWGTGTEWQEGDFNGDLAVDDSDLNLLLTNWNYPPASGSSVPEPASATILLLGTIAMFRRRKK